ncbi:MAG: hypothetical protein ACKORJ_02365 [Bacteroidota bacterium]
MRQQLLSLAFCAITLSLQGQSVYRSSRSGAWSDTGTWETKSPSGWIPAISLPDESTDTIRIRAGHTINLSDTRVVRRLLIEGQLSISNTGILTPTLQTNVIEASPGSIIHNQGKINSTPSSLSFRAGARYRHLFTDAEGSIPLATWDAESIIEVAG